MFMSENLKRTRSLVAYEEPNLSHKNAIDRYFNYLLKLSKFFYLFL
jgi:hypothetical protein